MLIYGLTTDGKQIPLTVDNNGKLTIAAEVTAQLGQLEVSNDTGNPIPINIVDGANVTQGAKTDSAMTDPTQPNSIISILKGVYTRLGDNSGSKGAEYISDTAAHTTTDVYIALQVLLDAKIGAYTTDTGASLTGNTIVGETLPANTIIYGRFKSITLQSGKVIAYKGI